MENQKKNSGILVGIIIGLVIALLIGVCLFATGTIGFKSNISTDKIHTSEKEETNDSDKDTYEQDNNNSSEKLNNTEQGFKLEPFDSNKFDTSGEYYLETVIKEYEENIGGERYYLRLIKNGRIIVTKKYGDFTSSISNISNVIDVAELPMRGTENSTYYFLLSNGDVYYYVLQDLSKGKKEATRVDNVSKVKRIINTTTYINGNQPPSFAIVAITNDEYKVIASE